MSLSAPMNQLISAVLQGAGLLVLIAVVTGSLRRVTLSPLKQSLVLGALLGLTVLLLEALSDSAHPGFVLDGRFMSSALAAAFGSLPALAVAAMLNALGQGWSTNLPGLVNVFGPLLTGFVALSWRRKIKPKMRNVIGSLVVLGLMLAVPLVLLHSLSSNGTRLPPLLL